jgi:hypothetical protein
MNQIFKKFTGLFNKDKKNDLFYDIKDVEGKFIAKNDIWAFDKVLQRIDQKNLSEKEYLSILNIEKFFCPHLFDHKMTEKVLMIVMTLCKKRNGKYINSLIGAQSKDGKYQGKYSQHELVEFYKNINIKN